MNFKKILILILLLLTLSVSYAKTIYSNSKCYIYSRASTSAAKIQIPKNTRLTYLKATGKFYKVKVKGKKVYILKKNTYEKQAKKIVEWKEGNKLWKTNTTASLLLLETNTTIEVKRCGGLNHFDVEPQTAEDTTNLLPNSWKCHPAILYLNDKRVPCSYNTMPHGKQTIKDNKFDGHFCIHLVGSKTHGTNTIQKEHQKAIEKASKWLLNN